jgi:hypothetical protein
VPGTRFGGGFDTCKAKIPVVYAAGSSVYTGARTASLLMAMRDLQLQSLGNVREAR